MKKNNRIVFYSPVSMLLFAFRYALGRMSIAPSVVADEIVAVWDELPVGTKEQMKREITEAISCDRAGMQCDIDQWQRVLDLPINKETEK